MLKKTVMSLICVAMMAVGGNALACCDWDRDVTSNTTVTAAPAANDYDVDYDVNDRAEAGGILQTRTTVRATAAGDDFAGTAAGAEGYSDVDVYANNWDTGRTSGAYTEASFNGRTEGAGVAFSGFGGVANIEIESDFYGSVGQRQLTQEINYQDNQGITAVNTSDATFSAHRLDTDYDCSRRFVAGAADSDSIYTRGTEVTGRSFVTIDPTGNNRSYEGMTASTAQIGSTNGHVDISEVNGTGAVGAIVQSPSVGYASGNASYSFTGSNAGAGMAQIQGSVQDFGSYSTAQSSGSSFVGAF